MLTKGEERRKRRAEAQRLKILKSAAEVFKRKGFLNATTKEIADGADVAEGTIYQYFKSKRELFIELLRKDADQARILLDNMPPLNPVDAEESLFRIFTTQFKIFRSRPFSTFLINEALGDKEVHEIFHNHLLKPMADEIQKRINKGIATGACRPVNEKIATQIFIALMIGFSVILHSKSDSYLDSMDTGDIRKTIGDILIHGLSLNSSVVIHV